MNRRTFLIVALIVVATLLSLPKAATAADMELGTNFWNLGWHRPNDCFQDARNVTGDNPWNPQFLKDIAIYRCFRFMDWDNTNTSLRAKWTDRPHRADAKQNPVAYEWMIDLCNRCNADMWVCIPHLAITHEQGNQPSDYALRLCLLVKTGVDMKDIDLKPLTDKLEKMTAEELVKAGGIKTCEPLNNPRKLYIEYSNETWNGMFKQAHYCTAEGAALKLDPMATLGNDGEQWTAGFRYHAWAAIRAFRATDLVFGADSKRTVKVLATQIGNAWLSGQHVEMLNDPKANPWKLKANAIAAAPYFGHAVVGDDPDAVKQLRDAIAKAAADSARLKSVADKAGLLLIAYEGGQHVLKKADVINRNQVMHDLYAEYLRKMSQYYSFFCHYAHVGRAGAGGCWGCMEQTGQDPKDAPKYRALMEWAKGPNSLAEPSK